MFHINSPPQAIESFAVTVKDIAQMLQSFGTELAETELPDEGKAIERLLQAHTEKYKKLKVSSCYEILVMHNVCVSRKIRHYYNCTNLVFFLPFMTGCNQVSVQGGSSSSLKPGDLRDGGRGPVGCADGLGDGAEVGELSSHHILSTSSLFMFL